MDINKLKEEVEEQSRNGRTSIYVRISDLEQLVTNEGFKKKLKKSKATRMYVDKRDIEFLIENYIKENEKGER